MEGAMKKMWWMGVLIAIVFLAVGVITFQVMADSVRSQLEPMPRINNYVVLGWDDSRTRCYNPDFSNVAVCLPPEP
jgi:hypothetical protein